MSMTERIAVHTGTGASLVTMSSRSERWLPTLLSMIAGMVDVIGFLSLGIFTAHVTGNIVVIGALVVRQSCIRRTDPGYSSFYRRGRRHLASCQGIEQAWYRADEIPSPDSISADYVRVDFQCHHETFCRSARLNGHDRGNDHGHGYGLSVCSLALNPAVGALNCGHDG